MLRLFIEPLSMEFADIYRAAADVYNCTPFHERNSGFDLHCDLVDQNTAYSQYTTLIGQGCRALAVDPSGGQRAFWLVPRSSISKTPLILANSVGLIDATYRGVIRAAVARRADPSGEYKLSHHERIVQIAAADLLPWEEVVIVDALPGPETLRGSGGFGSTGSTVVAGTTVAGTTVAGTAVAGTVVAGTTVAKA